MHALLANISDADLDQLNYERYHYPDPMVQKRLHAVYLKARLNCSYRTISLITGLHHNMVSIWVQTYQRDGIAGVITNRYGTNKSKLEAYAASILADFEAQPPRSSEQAAERIFELTGIRRSTQQVRVFLKAHGLQFRKCGHIPAKANPAVQREWIDTELTPAIEAAKDGRIHLLFCDAAHFVLQPFICFLWTAVRVFVKGAAGRNRINVLGAVDAITKEVTTFINDTYITADTLVAFLKMLREKYNDGKAIAIVLDNARYQHCFVVKAMAASLGIHLLFLPPYSPNLNIIERLWKFTKKQILHARYYANPAAFHDAIRQFFDSINQSSIEKLQSLLTLRFQLFDNENSRIYPL
jgi:transposase